MFSSVVMGLNDYLNAFCSAVFRNCFFGAREFSP